MTVAVDLAVRNALAAYLQSALTLSADVCQPDWFPATQALPHPVAVAIHNAGNVALLPRLGSGQLVSVVPNAGSSPPTALATYLLGEYTIPLAIDVWCATQYDRDAWAARVEAALNQPVQVGGAPVVGAADGLLLSASASDYFSAPIVLDFDGYQTPEMPEGTEREEWRVLFQGTARMDRLAQVTVTRQAALILQAQVDAAASLAATLTGTTPSTIFTGG